MYHFTGCCVSKLAMMRLSAIAMVILVLWATPSRANAQGSASEDENLILDFSETPSPDAPPPIGVVGEADR